MRQRAVEGRKPRQVGSHAVEEGKKAPGTLAFTTQRWPDPHRHPGSGLCKRLRWGGRTENQFYCAAVKEVKYLLTSPKLFFPRARSRERAPAASTQTWRVTANTRGRQTIAKRCSGRLEERPAHLYLLFFQFFSLPRRGLNARATSSDGYRRNCQLASAILQRQIRLGKPAAERGRIAEPDIHVSSRALVGIE